MFSVRMRMGCVTVDRMIDNDEVEGVPVMMLANKQDMEGALRVESIKEIFNQIAQRLSARESNVLAVSALRGCANNYSN
jgi:ADP-ribosylation factor related protein 1